jgi:hypothetical protein
MTICSILPQENTPILLWQPITLDAPQLVLHHWPSVTIFVELELLCICMAL